MQSLALVQFILADFGISVICAVLFSWRRAVVCKTGAAVCGTSAHQD
jgi:hypothetical protein